MRQTFTEGQTVYVKHYGPHRKAVVVNPDVEKQAFSYSYAKRRTVHYVGVSYVQPDGSVQVDRVWDVINTRTAIITEEAHAELQHGKQIANRRGLIAECNQFERDFVRYIDQAEIITRANGCETSQDDLTELALYLRGTFSFRADYSRMTRDDVRKLRRDNAEAARVAAEELHAMGVKP